jgi:hypothetical protein
MDLSVLNLRRARGAENDVASLQKFLHALEAELENYKASLNGVAAVRDTALKELARLDPNHFLLMKENRSKIYDEAFYQKKPKP